MNAPLGAGFERQQAAEKAIGEAGSGSAALQRRVNQRVRQWPLGPEVPAPIVAETCVVRWFGAKLNAGLEGPHYPTCW